MTTGSLKGDWTEDAFDIFDMTLGAIIVASVLLIFVLILICE